MGAVLVFSAHGVPPRVRTEAQERELRVIDATCPLVTKVHLEALKFAREGRTLILIGHRDHQEIIGTSGEAPDRTVVVGSVEEVDELQVPDPTRLAFLTQTTLSLYDTQEIVARLRQRFPSIVGPASDDICYATQNRQEAVEALTPRSGIDFGGGFGEQLEFEPPGGSGETRRRSRALDRRCERYRCILGGGSEERWD